VNQKQAGKFNFKQFIKLFRETVNFPFAIADRKSLEPKNLNVFHFYKG